MTDATVPRHLDTIVSDATGVEIDRLHEDFRDEVARAGIPAGARLLEIGFGHGRFLDWARDRGYRVSGTEISADYCAAVRARGHDVHHGPLDAIAFPEDARFDAVVAFDVFEHLTVAELAATLHTAHRLLAPGGIVLARFPNGGSPFGRAFQNGDVTHRTALNRFSMEQLADMTGFAVAYCGNAARPSGGNRSKLLKWLTFKFCDLIEIAVGVLYYRGRRIPLDANMTCVLRAKAPPAP